jgi:N-acyl-D-aspartate/D-glutamate deacylase
VVLVGEVEEQARQTIDADGHVVAPGFVDVHTHYDAQVFWDPFLTPSLLHGVTTVVGGNCGFSIAPLEVEAAEYLMRMLARVEGMPLEALEAGVPWDWRSTREYYARLDGRLAINAGFLVGHSTIRRVAMGEAATKRKANGQELEAMAALLTAGLEAGGLGFSSSWGVAHRDANGDPVPSRWADADELVALAAVCRNFEGTSLEFIPDTSNFDGTVDLMSRMSTTAQRPLNWNLMVVDAARLDECLIQLGAGTYARERGGRIVALTMPIAPTELRFSFCTGFLLDSIPGWAKPMVLPLPEKLVLLRDPVERRRLEQLAEQPGPHHNPITRLADWVDWIIAETFSPEMKRYEGRGVADIAAEEHKRPFDALLDIVCADNLRTISVPRPSIQTDADWQARLRVWRDERSLIGGSDAGAHLDFSSQFTLPTWFLEHVVREQQLMPLEEAIHHLTDAPACLYGLRDRGRLVEGCRADIVVFDEATVGAGPVHTRFDLPAGAGRLYAEAIGIDHVLVNGVQVVQHATITDQRPGTLLRSGRDTYTPTLV